MPPAASTGTSTASTISGTSTMVATSPVWPPASYPCATTMSTPFSTCRWACEALPARAATGTPAACTCSITSTGGEPSALAIRRIGCSSATSTCERATECSQPRTPSPSSPSASGGTPSFSRVCCTKSLWPCGINVDRSSCVPSVGTLAGITMSTPYGLPSVFASIHVNARSRSSASLNRTHPSTPSPPARLIAAATCSDGVKPKIGCSMPNWSHRLVRMFLHVSACPLIIGFPAGGPADLVDQPQRPRHLVARERLAHVSVQFGQCRRRALARVHDRADALAEQVVRDADHERVEHVGVRLQHALDLF